MKTLLISLALVALSEAMFNFRQRSDGYVPPSDSKPSRPGSTYDNTPKPPRTGYENGPSGYSNVPSGYDKGPSGYSDRQPGYSDGPSGYKQPGYSDGPSGYRQPGYSDGPSGYSHPQGYSSHSGYGPGGGYGRDPYPPHQGEALDFVDKLWERVNDIERGNKFAAEQLDALDARMSLLKKEVDELELVIFKARARTDQNQNNDIDVLDRHLVDLTQNLDELDSSIYWLEQENLYNRYNLTELENTYAQEKDQDIRQDGDVARLYAAVLDFKAKLFLVLRNEFELFDDKVEVTSGKLDNTKTRELLRMCETGSVTLYADDRKAEYVFQSDFADVPSVIYSVTGFEADLDVRGEPRSYGYGPPPKEPNAIGFLVQAYTTKRSVTFQGIEMSFGDTTKLSVDVDFQVCSILPGTVVNFGH